jgi:hypothetical protein
MDVRSLDGNHIFAAKNVRNLSLSPKGEEIELIAEPPFAAVATRALGQVRSLTLYDFTGAEKADGEETVLNRVMASVTDFLETGRTRGLGKTWVRFAGAPKSVQFAIKDRRLQVAWEDTRGKTGNASIVPNKENTDNKDVIVTASVRPFKRPVLWAVDTIRSLPFIGPGPIEWMEGRAFAVKDYVRQVRYRVLGTSEESIPGGLKDEAPAVVLNLPAGLEIGDLSAKETWPPLPFKPPAFSRKLEGEGEWKPTGPNFLRRLKNAPSAFYRSFVRPDKERPYVTVQLFAMDMRQLELHMEGGIEDPQSTTGSAGEGRIPRKKDLMERTVVAFNGAFKTEHGAYGMMVEKNVLLPPQNGSATVATLPDGSVFMGTWPEGAAIPDKMDSFRQNMDPLVENGVVNPKKRRLWGYTLGNDMSKMQTVRSGLCMSDKGYMIYAWGDEVSALTLGIAMNAAGCSYGMHLDMNPYHTTFMYYSFSLPDESKRPEYKFEPALPQTMYSPHRYVNGASKDFFFASLRDETPGPGWSADGLAQPAPAFLPSIFQKSADGCDLIAVDLNRVSAHLTPGLVPPQLAPPNHSPDNPSGKDRLLVDVDLGPWSDNRGQIVNDATQATVSNNSSVLATDDLGNPMIGTWPFLPSVHVLDAVEGTLPSDTEKSQGRVVGMGIRGHWFIIVVGDRDNVSTQLKTEGATDRSSIFPASIGKDGRPRVFVRRERGMADLSGKMILESDMSTTHFQISASPKPQGAKRMETAFDFAPDAQTAGPSPSSSKDKHATH